MQQEELVRSQCEVGWPEAGKDQAAEVRCMLCSQKGKLRLREITQLLRSKDWAWMHISWLENTRYFH